MREIANFYNIPFHSLIIIDDSPKSLVNEQGWHGLLVNNPRAGFQFSDLERYLGTQPSESAPQATRISRILDSFMQAKTLMVACKLDLFTFLEKNGPQSGQDISAGLGINQFNLYDFLDALVALSVLERDGIKETAVYRNTPEASALLVDGGSH